MPKKLNFYLTILTVLVGIGWAAYSEYRTLKFENQNLNLKLNLSNENLNKANGQIEITNIKLKEVQDHNNALKQSYEESYVLTKKLIQTNKIRDDAIKQTKAKLEQRLDAIEKSNQPEDQKQALKSSELIDNLHDHFNKEQEN
jgi:hypothetical protein